jgi:hypothetical protein
MPRSLTLRDRAPIRRRLRAANSELAVSYRRDPGVRQPIHTFIGGAHLFRADSASTLGVAALAALDLPRDLGETIRARVVDKLRREPVEDYRLDFEDGYGTRPDAEEDGHAESAAEQVAHGLRAGTLPPFIGIRIKPMSDELHDRGLRTLDIFVTTIARATKKQFPPNFAVTLTKVMTPAHVSAVARACGALERRLKLRTALQLEVMIETPQSVLARDGSCAVPSLVAAGNRRVRAALFGTYDYTTLCGISASWQHMRHPACDFAKEMMRVSLADTGVWLSDGATSVMPVGSREDAHRAWKRQFDDVQHSLINGYYQGWDLHPAQPPIRYAANYAFFLAARPAATVRLRNFIEKAAQATLIGDVFDDAATGQALLNFFVRGLSSGALTTDEAQETGLSSEELQGRSFAKIVDMRRRP